MAVLMRSGLAVKLPKTKPIDPGSIAPAGEHIRTMRVCVCVYAERVIQYCWFFFWTLLPRAAFFFGCGPNKHQEKNCFQSGLNPYKTSMGPFFLDSIVVVVVVVVEHLCAYVNFLHVHRQHTRYSTYAMQRANEHNHESYRIMWSCEYIVCVCASV